MKLSVLPMADVAFSVVGPFVGTVSGCGVAIASKSDGADCEGS